MNANSPRQGFGEAAWVTDSCTLPTTERPLRVAEFDDVFAGALRSQQRLAAHRLRWRFDRGAEPMVRDLTRRETECCSFFSFTIGSADDSDVVVDVEVPVSHAAVLDALAARAAAGLPRGG